VSRTKEVAPASQGLWGEGTLLSRGRSITISQERKYLVLDRRNRYEKKREKKLNRPRGENYVCVKKDDLSPMVKGGQ